MTDIRPVNEDDWRVMRDIRLDALRDDPGAFGSSYAREAVFTEADWRRRAGGHGFLAYLPELSPSPVGIVGGVEDKNAGANAGAPGTAEMVSMWVRPQARGRQVGTALVAAIVAWARAHDITRLNLCVTETNKPARLLYERCGFTLTGERKPLPSDPARSEIGMTLRL
jgi:ribosomal protein S18 acetylase RimI-like enzyme